MGTDVTVPVPPAPDEVGGLEAAQRIREQVKQYLFPIVCMSTYPTQEARARALADAERRGVH